MSIQISTGAIWRLVTKATSMAQSPSISKPTPASIESGHPFIQNIRDAVANVVIGQQEVVDRMLIALLTGGHLLLQGVPGLAKTLLVNALAKAIDLRFGRVQFTIDMLPADIIGSEILDQQTGTFHV